MKNPYRYEIAGIFALGPLILVGELWRRWGDLLSPGCIDDFFYFLIAMFAAYLLRKRKYAGQLLWLYACGIGTFGIYFSLFASLYHYDQGDASGVAMPVVVAFKCVGVFLVTLISVRAFKILRTKRFFEN
ncbi:MAG: hypothetical protein MI923_01915 [Phycisphaerales bacterium]|nr:hypothetical protein [Phycisphaerales bacterium]